MELRRLRLGWTRQAVCGPFGRRGTDLRDWNS